MNEPEPIFLGALPAMARGDVADRYIDISADLVESEGETIESATFTATLEGSAEAVPGVVAENSITLGTGRVDFQLTAPAAAGTYHLSAVFTISDGQRITKTATVEAV